VNIKMISSLTRSAPRTRIPRTFPSRLFFRFYL